MYVVAKSEILRDLGQPVRLVFRKISPNRPCCAGIEGGHNQSACRLQCFIGSADLMFITFTLSVASFVFESII